MGDSALREWIEQRQGAGLSPKQLRFWQVILNLPKRIVDEWLKSPNRKVWDRLTPVDRALIENVCGAGVMNGLARGEALQGPVLRDYPSRGVAARVLPIPVLRELESVANEVLDREAARDPLFAEVLAAQRAFRADYAVWKTLGFLPRDF